MQILGVYRNCLCHINISTWQHHPWNVVLPLSTNNAIDIHQAKRYWTPVGVTGIVFLTVTCYVGYWYQKRLRLHFRELVEQL